MKRFQFSLETLLKLKARKEEEEIRRLSSVVSKLNQLIAEKETNQLEISRSYQMITNSAKVGTSLNDYISIERYIQGLTKRNEDLESRIANQNSEVDLVRKDVLVARKNKRVIEILKERRYLEWKKKRKRIEQKEVEEFNLMIDEFHKWEPPFQSNQKTKQKPKTFRILSREDGGDELTSDFKTLRDFYEKFYLGQGKQNG
ncbi:MAG: flagellar FliJ family protein [Leptospira sp.]|nr:flagellar FliJ family protein [Leptospira sp.]